MTYRIIFNKVNILIFRSINKYFISNKKLKFNFVIGIIALIFISTVLIEKVSILPPIQAQNNNDLASSIQQGVRNQIGNTLSNTQLGSNNPLSTQQQQSTNNNNNNFAFQTNTPGNNNNTVIQSQPQQQQQQEQQQQLQTSGTNSINNNNNIINGNNPSTTPSNIPVGSNFIISGPLSSFLSTPSGNWVVNGSWVLKVQNGNVSFFRGFMQWDPTNITKLPHTHSFVNFNADPSSQGSISLGPDRVTDIKGTMDIGANNRIEWTNVPAEIKTAGNTITVIILDDSKTGNHFNNYPVFGKIANVEKCSDNGGFGANMEYDPTVAKCSL